VSSETGFFDVLYLRIFVTLSSAYDGRFYFGLKPPGLVAEIVHAICHFRWLLHKFSLRFILLLEGEPVAHSYIVDRMIAEFAAATIVFARAVDVCDTKQGGNNDGVKTDQLAENLEVLI
jgi:hypothetical protein